VLSGDDSVSYNPQRPDRGGDVHTCERRDASVAGVENVLVTGEGISLPPNVNDRSGREATVLQSTVY